MTVMPKYLGPMPENLRVLVRRWIDEGWRSQLAVTSSGMEMLLITGGPGGSAFLDANGDVWQRSVDQDEFTRLDDGPFKIALIALAAEQRPEFKAWLPVRPPAATVCSTCDGSGHLPSNLRLQCHECFGLGWK